MIAYNNLIHTYFRHEIGKIIADVGETDPDIWGELLDGKPEKVLSLLLLMANDITSDKIEEQTGFWKYVMEHDKLREYTEGEKVDEEGNTIFHYCASHKTGKDGTKILQLLPNDSYFHVHQRKNHSQDTVFHVAMKNKRTDVFDKLITRFNSQFWYAMHPWLEHLLNATNIDGNSFLSIAIKTDVDDNDIIGMLKELYDEQIRPLCEASDRDMNTILHLAMKFGRDDLLQYLAKKPVLMMQQNLDGHTALHVAVRQNNVSTVKAFFKYFKSRKIDINQSTGEKETALHIAAKKGSTEMTKLLVDLGADYAARDEDGNTPLHDLLQLLHLEADDEEEDKTEMFFDAWKTAVENCVTWWSKKLKRSVPDRDSTLYREMRHDAMYSLRSEITNNEGLSVLEYAATLGLPDCVHIMLTHRNVFVFQKESGRGYGKKGHKYKPKFEIEVSNLMPEYRAKIKTKEGTKLRYILKNKSAEENNQVKIGVRPRNFLETLSKVRPPMKVSEVLGTFPMDKLAKHQWYIYQIFIIVALLLHMAIMSWYTYESQTSLKGLNGTYPNRDSIDKTSSDFIIMVYSSTLAVIFLVAIIYTQIRQKVKGEVNVYEDKETFSDYIEAEGAALNSLTHLVAFVAENLSIIVPVIFIALSILLVILSHYVESFSAENYVWVKAIVILTGWIVVLILGRAYSPIFNFISVLKFIFVKNMVPFLLFYVILSIAFGCAIQLQFQLLREETAKLEEFGSISTFGNFFASVPHVMWELFIMTEGMDTNLRHIQNVGYLFELDKYRSFIIELLIFIYGLISTIILLNMLIAAMNTTYSDVITKQGKGWRQYQVQNQLTSAKFQFLQSNGQAVKPMCIQT